jgi:hypothetical protein
MQVTAIDAGYRNFAWCCKNRYQVLHHNVVDLWPLAPNRRRKPTRDDLVRVSYAWCQAHRQMLLDSDVIVLENQIREPYVIINTVIQTLFIDKVRVVHPMRVAAYWQLPVQRAYKKARAIQLVKELGVPLAGGKQDDLADTYLMAEWQLRN